MNGAVSDNGSSEIHGIILNALHVSGKCTERDATVIAASRQCFFADYSHAGRTAVTERTGSLIAQDSCMA